MKDIYLLLKTLCSPYHEQGTLCETHVQKTYRGKISKHDLFWQIFIILLKFAVLDSCFMVHFRNLVADRHFDYDSRVCF